MRDNLAKIDPPPFLLETARLLQDEDPDLWNWFRSEQAQDEQTERVRLDLLKSTYRMDPSDEPELYRLASEAAQRLGLNLPVTLYQAQHFEGLNASVAYVPNEAHVVLHGNLRETLTDDELRCVFGHELGHLLLWDLDDHRYLYAYQLLSALSWDESTGAEPYQRTARLYHLFVEVFCDRAAAVVSADRNIAIEALVKIGTGTDKVQAENYLRQAEEILASENLGAEGFTHPEMYLRAVAVNLWMEQQDHYERRIAESIEGPLLFAEMDLFAQRRMEKTTKLLLQHILQPDWMCTEAVQGHARLFCEDVSDLLRCESLPPPVHFQDKKAREYLCFVLLDFVAADRDLDPAALAHAIEISDRWQVADLFREIAVRELRMRKRQFDAIRESTATSP